jgi:hypothetical protein
MIGQDLQKQELRKCPVADQCGMTCIYPGSYEACCYFRFFRDKKKKGAGNGK